MSKSQHTSWEIFYSKLNISKCHKFGVMQLYLDFVARVINGVSPSTRHKCLMLNFKYWETATEIQKMKSELITHICTPLCRLSCCSNRKGKYSLSDCMLTNMTPMSHTGVLKCKKYKKNDARCEKLTEHHLLPRECRNYTCEKIWEVVEAYPFIDFSRHEFEEALRREERYYNSLENFIKRGMDDKRFTTEKRTFLRALERSLLGG